MLADVRAQVALSLYTDFENFSVFKPAPHQEKAVHDVLAWIIHERTVSVAPTAGNGLSTRVAG